MGGVEEDESCRNRSYKAVKVEKSNRMLESVVNRTAGLEKREDWRRREGEVTSTWLLTDLL